MVTGGAKRIVCLANSRKLGGRCIAGKEVLPNGTFGAWIRPVTDQGGGEVSAWECQYPDGTEPKVLDVLDVPLLGHVPKDYQRENWALAPKPPWNKSRELTLEAAAGCVDPGELLWTPGYSTYNGRNDYVPLQEAKGLTDSLRFIKVNNLTLSAFAPGENFGNPTRRVLGGFRYAGLDYWLWVTDVAWEEEYLELPDGEYPVGEAFLTISLGEPFQNQQGEYHAYKLIAAIITPGGGPAWKAQRSFPS